MATCAPPTTRALLTEIDVLRGALKYSAASSAVYGVASACDTTAVLEKLAHVNAGAREVVPEARKWARSSR